MTGTNWSRTCGTPTAEHEQRGQHPKPGRTVAPSRASSGSEARSVLKCSVQMNQGRSETQAQWWCKRLRPRTNDEERWLGFQTEPLPRRELPSATLARVPRDGLKGRP